jgi:CHAT domain
MTAMKYRNFDIEMYDYEEQDGNESYKVRVTNSPAGDQSPSQAERVTLPRELRFRATGFQRYDWIGFDLNEAIEFGEALGECLLPARARERWSKSIPVLKEDEALRLRLKFDAWQVADLPWELVYVGRSTAWAGEKGANGFLALDRRVSIVRYEYTDHGFAPFETGDTSIRQVVLLSSPKSLQVLDLASEAAGIADSLQSITNLTLEFLESPTVQALQEALEHPTHMFHFAGHGAFERYLGKKLGSVEGTGNIVLCGPDGMPTLFPADKLALNLVQCGVRIAFLNSEQSASRDRSHRLSGLAPALAHAGIPAVIGLNGLISDEGAITFSKAFYRNLAAGNPVDTAVTNARIAMFTQGEDDWQPLYWSIPVLYLRTDDSTLFPIRPRPPKASDERSPTLSNSALRQMLTKSFGKGDLELLCADITAAFERDRIQQRISLEIVGGNTLETYALSLIEHLDRRGLLNYLVDAMRAARPKLFEAAKV